MIRSRNRTPRLFTPVIVAIFALTYALIAARRLHWLPIGRPAGALIGAVLVVMAGIALAPGRPEALTPEESFAAVDANTIALLLAMMLLTAYLERAGFFNRVAGAILRLCRTPRKLLAAVAVLAAVLSVFLVNDTVCLFLTPVVVLVCARARLPLGPYLIALATSANIGSAATLVGNPQNMIVGNLSGIAFTRFIALCGPAALVALTVNIGLLQAIYGRKLPSTFTLPEQVENRALTPGVRGQFALVCVVTVLIVAGFFVGLHLAYTALAGVAVLMLADRREPREAFARVDWSLLVFFCGLFIVVAGLRETGLVDEIWRAAAPALDLSTASGAAAFTGLMAAGSNLVSNVPMVLLAGPHLGAGENAELGWVLLAFVTTVAGNLTLVGSVANIIVAERARDHYTLGFIEYLKFGAVSTTLALAAGVPTVYAASRIFAPPS